MLKPKLIVSRILVLSFIAAAMEATTTSKSMAATGVGTKLASKIKNHDSGWELRTAPLALLARWYTFDVSYRVSKNWALGPALVVYSADEIGQMFAPSLNGQALGLNGNYYFSSVERDTWYLSTHGYVEKYRSYAHAQKGFKEFDGFRLNLVAGYQWRWSSINLMMGAGTEYRNHRVEDRTESVSISNVNTNDSGTVPHFELKLGIEL